MESKWYILHTMSGHEARVSRIIGEQSRKKGIESLFEQIVIPTEAVVEVKKGQKQSVQKKFLPGYVLVKMVMNDDSWHLVKSIPRVAGFLGSSGKPVPISEREANEILAQIEKGAVTDKSLVNFTVGEAVKVIDGPFDSFIGSVIEVDADKSRLKVSVSIFGRATPIDLEFSQVEKC